MTWSVELPGGTFSDIDGRAGDTIRRRGIIAQANSSRGSILNISGSIEDNNNMTTVKCVAFNAANIQGVGSKPVQVIFYGEWIV